MRLRVAMMAEAPLRAALTVLPRARPRPAPKASGSARGVCIWGRFAMGSEERWTFGTVGMVRLLYAVFVSADPRL